MIEAKFREVSNIVDGLYKRMDSYYEIERNAPPLPVTKHFLRVEYKSTIIDVQFELGNTNVAQFVCLMHSKRELHPLTLTTKSHLIRLFSINKYPWVIKCDDKSTKALVENSLEQFGLNALGKKYAFEPDIDIQKSGQKYIVKTKYYLGFDNKEDSLLPMVLFYKGLIDFGSRLK